jgi:hypothetical protein
MTGRLALENQLYAINEASGALQEFYRKIEANNGTLRAFRGLIAA